LIAGDVGFDARIMPFPSALKCSDCCKAVDTEYIGHLVA
jgi:hypothetical protein